MLESYHGETMITYMRTDLCEFEVWSLQESRSNIIEFRKTNEWMQTRAYKNQEKNVCMYLSMLHLHKFRYTQLDSIL